MRKADVPRRMKAEIDLLIARARADSPPRSPLPTTEELAGWYEGTLVGPRRQEVAEHLLTSDELYAAWRDLGDFLMEDRRSSQAPKAAKFSELGAWLTRWRLTRPVIGGVFASAMVLLLVVVTSPLLNRDGGLDDQIEQLAAAVAALGPHDLEGAWRWPQVAMVDGRYVTFRARGGTEGVVPEDRLSVAAGVRRGIEEQMPPTARWLAEAGALPATPPTCPGTAATRCEARRSLLEELGRWSLLTQVACSAPERVPRGPFFAHGADAAAALADRLAPLDDDGRLAPILNPLRGVSGTPTQQPVCDAAARLLDLALN